jgi:hypothetical protein
MGGVSVQDVFVAEAPGDGLIEVALPGLRQVLTPAAPLAVPPENGRKAQHFAVSK